MVSRSLEEGVSSSEAVAAPEGGSSEGTRSRRSADSALPSIEESKQAVDDDDDEDVEEVETKPSGSLYTRREHAFVLFAGVFMSFNSGYVNGSCLSGFVAPSGRAQAVSTFTIVISNSALALADGDFSGFGFLSGMVLSFTFGACLSGILTPDPIPYRIEPMYGPTFLLGAAILVSSSVMAAFERNEDFVFYLVAAANGIQNGISSAYSENLIRSTGFTGATSDICIYIAQLCRGNRDNSWRLVVLTSLLMSFWVGGFLGYWSAKRFTSFSLMINAGLFLIIGGSLVAFLTYELGISVKAALLGTWQWKRAISKLHVALAESSGFFDKTVEEQIDDMFSQLDKDKNGAIDADELYQGLRHSGVRVSRKQCKKMVQQADTDGDGTLSKSEWFNILQSSGCKQGMSERSEKSISTRR